MNVKERHMVEAQSGHLATSNRMSEAQGLQQSPWLARDGVRRDYARLPRGRISTLSQVFSGADEPLGPCSVHDSALAMLRPLHLEVRS